MMVSRLSDRLEPTNKKPPGFDLRGFLLPEMVWRNFLYVRTIELKQPVFNYLRHDKGIALSLFFVGTLM